jgi:hypothetical protein
MYIIHHPQWQQHYVCIQLTHKQQPALHTSESDEHIDAKTHGLYLTYTETSQVLFKTHLYSSMYRCEGCTQDKGDRSSS